MSRFDTLLERFQSGEESTWEAEELALLIRDDSDRGERLYDVMMLEADLYDIYAGIAPVQAAPRRAGRMRARLAVAWGIAVFLLVGMAVLLLMRRPSSPSRPEILPTAPSPPKSAEPTPPDRAPGREREHERDEDEHGSKRDEIEREYRKELREVERKRLEGKTGEAEKKLAEIERERARKLREMERRKNER